MARIIICAILGTHAIHNKYDTIINGLRIDLKSAEDVI